MQDMVMVRARVGDRVKVRVRNRVRVRDRVRSEIRQIEIRQIGLEPLKSLTFPGEWPP